MARRILLIDQTARHLETIRQALLAAGDEVFTHSGSTDTLLARIRVILPDTVIVALESPDHNILEQIGTVMRERPKPIILFVDRSSEDQTREAIAAGVSAYVVDGMHPQRISAVLEVAINRFQAFQAVHRELERTRAALAERKRIERAKGILMRQRGLSEDEAYRALRKLAMDRNRPLVEIAEQVITVSTLLGKP